MFLDGQFSPQMCFLSVNLVHKKKKQQWQLWCVYNVDTFNGYNDSVSHIHRPNGCLQNKTYLIRVNGHFGL